MVLGVPLQRNSVIEANNFNEGAIASVADMADLQCKIDESEVEKLHEGMPIV